MDWCTLWRCLALPWVVLFVLTARAGASDVYGSYAVLAWEPSNGPVTSYEVYVDRNGSGFGATPSSISPGVVAFLFGEPGDTIRVRVTAFRASPAAVSEPSEPSELLRFVPPEPPSSAPSLIENGSFEADGSPGSFARVRSGSHLVGWQVIGSSIDLVGGHWNAADGAASLDLNGSKAGGVSQSFATEPGRFYYVYFSVAGSPDCTPWVKSLRVSAAGEVRDLEIDSAGGSRSSMGWVRPDPLVFQADASQTTLELRSTSSGGCGPTLDDVVVQAER